MWLVPPDDWTPKGLAVLLTTDAGLASVRWTSLYTLVGVVAGERPGISCSPGAVRALGWTSMSKELDMRSVVGDPELERGMASLEKALLEEGGADTLSIRRMLDFISSAEEAWDCPSANGVLGLESGVTLFEGHRASDEFWWTGAAVTGGF